MPAPKLDERTFRRIVDQARGLAGLYTPEWTGAADAADPGSRMLEILARLVELLVERLNKVPDKNFLSFLDTVGVEPFPGSPACAPVTFQLSKQAVEGAEVPAGTQVATTQTETADARVFETESAFFASPARLLRVIDLVPESDAYQVLEGGELPPPADELADPARAVVALAPGAPALEALGHVLYLGGAGLFGRDETVDLTLGFALAAGAAALNDTDLAWQRWSAEEEDWVELDAAYQPSTGGVSVSFAAFPGSAASEVDGVEGHWIACRYLGDPAAAAELPVVTAIAGLVAPPGGGLALAAADRAFSNAAPLDLSKPFLPFGERPRYGDVFYLTSAAAFSGDVAEVTLRFTLRAYTDAEIGALFANIPAATTVTSTVDWQVLDAAGRWRTLTTFVHELSVATDLSVSRSLTRDGAAANGEDGTFFGSGGSNEAAFRLILPADVGAGAVHGATGPWLRALLRSEGPYGRDGFVVAGTDPPVFVGSTFLPPVVEGVEIEYRHRGDALPVERIKTRNNLSFADHDLAPAAPLVPFVAVTAQQVGAASGVFAAQPALYLAFDQPLGNAYVSLYAQLRESAPTAGSPLETGEPQVVWEVFGVDGAWHALDADDQSRHLTTSGTVGFVAPATSAAAPLFPLLFTDPATSAPHWYRARLASGRYDHPPALLGIFLNTVMADNRETVSPNALIGSADGRPGQQLDLVKAPVLAGELWVREPEVPSQDELEELVGDFNRQAAREGLPELTADDLVETAAAGAEGADAAIHVRWLRVPNFLASGPRSRHYTLDAVGGRLSFGGRDGGLIPPAGKDNLVLRGFRTGGGESANALAPALAIRELKTSLPFVDKVWNVQGAVGGADPWDLDATLRFGPQTIKNRGRAVTTEDYEWMVLERFSQVARVRCLATRRPLAGGGLGFQPGAVTLIVVPRGSDRVPRPSPGLLRRIEDFLREKTLGSITADVYVVGPDFESIEIEASVRPLSPAESHRVSRRVAAALDVFFHPLSGGEDGAGWAFGRSVYRSEIYAVIARTEGVDHVRRVVFTADPAAETLSVGENSLVASGDHRVEVS